MTATKTTKTTKSTTKKTEQPVEESVENQEVEKPKAKEEKKKVTLDTQVEVFNNTTGRLIYEAKKGNGYLYLERFMDSDIMTVEELQVLKNTARAMLTNGWLYVDDEDVLDFLRLGSIKDSVKNPQVLENAVDNGETEEIVNLADKLSKSSQEVLYGILKERYRNQEFSNAHVIKAVEDKLGVAKDNSLLQG